MRTAIFALAVLPVLQHRAFAAPDQELLQEAVRTWRTAEQAGQRVEVGYVFNVPDGKGSSISIAKRVLLDFGQVVHVSDESNLPRRRDGSVVFATVANDRYSFKLAKSTPDGPFKLAAYYENPAATREALQAELTGGCGIPWSFLRPLAASTEDGTFRIERITRSTTGSVPGVVITGAFRPAVPTPGIPIVEQVELTCDTGKMWAVTRARGTVVSGTSAGIPISIAVTYDADSKGRPVPRTYTLTHHNKTSGDQVYKTEYHTWVYRDAIPGEEFTLTAFGLPEPIGFERPTRPSQWHWPVAVGGGFIVFTALFTYLRRRSTRRHVALASTG